MISNMTTDDLLEELSGYGIVTVRKGLFTVAASPYLKGKAESWSIEVRLPGYITPQATQSYVKFEGQTLREVTEAAFSSLEDYVNSEISSADRARYQKDFELYNSEAWLAENPRTWVRDYIPPIVWGQRRGGFYT